MNDEIVLYTNPQSRGGIVHWMLEEVGCPYRLEIVEYGDPMKSTEYRSINPMGKVPALTHGETVVTETPAILCYLADAFPQAGLAPEPAQRGDYYRWLFFAASCVEAAVSNHSAGWDPAPEKQKSFGYGSYEQVVETMAVAVKDKAYIAGGKFSAADVYVGSMLNWTMLYGVMDKRPEFEAYCNGLLKRPAAVRVWNQKAK